LIPAIEKAVKNPELKARIEKMQSVVEYKSPTELKKMVAEEYESSLAIAIKVGLRNK
jgi:tripartite-type tricarboxylate transporter receptor subunit TctC